MPTAEKLQDFRQSWRPTPETVDLAIKRAIEIARPLACFYFRLLGAWRGY
jgi:hypothetical protein